MEYILTPFFWGCILPATLAGYTDYKEYRLPNYLTLTILVLGLIYKSYTVDWKTAFAAAGIGFLIGLAGNLLGQSGMGDTKLISGIAAWVGLNNLLAILFVAGILGVAWGIYKIIKAGKVIEYYKSIKTALFNVIVLRRLQIRKLPEDEEKTQADVIAFGTCIVIALWINTIAGINGIDLISIII